MDQYQIILDKCLKCVKERQYSEAVTYAHTLLDIYEKEPGKYEITNVFSNIEQIYYNTPNAIQYVTYMQRLISILEGEGRLYEMAKTMYYLGVDYIAVRNLDGAEIILNDVMSVAKKIDAFDVQADVINGYGNIYEYKEENQKALEYYLIALNMASEYDYNDGKRFSHNVGYAYRKLGKYGKAIHYLKECISFLDTVDMPGRHANTWNELGCAYTLNGDYRLAHEALDKGCDYSLESKSNAFLKENYQFKSQLYELEKDYEKALVYQKKLYEKSELINRDRHNKELSDLKYKHDINSIELENEIIKHKNKELEAYSKALDKSNQSLVKSISETKIMQRKAIQSEKNASYNRMMIGVAHKVNTSISNINLMTALIQKEISTFSSKLDQSNLSKEDLCNCIDSTFGSLELIHNSSDKVAKFIESVKDVSISLSEMNASGTFKEMLDECISDNKESIDDSNCRVKLFLQEDLPTISAFNMFKRIINQLFDNAFKYAFDGEDNQIEIRIFFNNKGKIELVFKDNGIGIKEDEAMKIFDPFYTSNMGSLGGAGMGLYIVHKTVSEILQGDIVCKSETGKGTEFVIEVPNQFTTL